LILALTTSLGLHWAFLQSIAWVAMLAGNLQTTVFTVAVVRTFDGKHPCPLCKAIAQSKKADKKSEFPALIKKLEFLSHAEGQLPAVPSHFWLITSGDTFAPSRPNVPPAPPPRVRFI
jgi:hypothetical protein